MLQILNILFKQQFRMYLTYVYEKIVSYDIHIKVTFDNLVIDIVRSNYINSLEIMCGFDAKHIENLKQLI
jgi:hypothetical protein